MFIDTHCHLADNNDVKAYLERATKNNVKNVICAAADYSDIPKILKLMENFNQIYSTLGIHPDSADIERQDFITSDIANNAKVLGIGEIGLDYHYGNENKIKQCDLFSWQLDLAKKYNLPVAIHTRDAEFDTANILIKSKVLGVLHCFTGSYDFAKKMLDIGFFVSASGIITFKNAESLRETFKKIPIDRIVIETDSPYCAPVPFRGKECESYMIIETAKVLSSLKGISLSEMEIILMNNTKKLYPKWQEKL